MARRLAAVFAVLLVCTARGAGQGADLPAKDAFLREAREALARSQEQSHQFAYKERRTELHLNPFGRMGDGDTIVSEVRPSPNPRLTYRRVIERNGSPVSQQELDRQDADYRARVARLAKEQSTEDDRLARKRAQMVVDDVVNMLQFEISRREIKNDRPVIVVTFSGRPDARPMTREGRVAKVFRGQLWVDEATHELTDVKAVATDNVSFGGFIAKIYEGTEATVERREIAPGVWMPTRLTLTGNIRALFRKTHLDHSVEWFDYRRLP